MILFVGGSSLEPVLLWLWRHQHPWTSGSSLPYFLCCFRKCKRMAQYSWNRETLCHAKFIFVCQSNYLKYFFFFWWLKQVFWCPRIPRRTAMWAPTSHARRALIGSSSSVQVERGPGGGAPMSGGFHKWGYPNSWMVCSGKSNYMDDLGYPYLRKPPYA